MWYMHATSIVAESILFVFFVLFTENLSPLSLSQRWSIVMFLPRFIRSPRLLSGNPLACAISQAAYCFFFKHVEFYGSYFFMSTWPPHFFVVHWTAKYLDKLRYSQKFFTRIIGTFWWLIFRENDERPFRWLRLYTYFCPSTLKLH